MRSITVTLWLTLDGVVQGPGRPDEDTRGGFTHGGWGQRYGDEVMGREMAQDMAKPGDMLFGRRTWEDFITAWGRRTDDNPFSSPMNAATKYVVSRTMQDADAWQNSILLRGEAVDTVTDLKADSDRDLSIIGSASLVRGPAHRRSDRPLHLAVLPADAGQRHATVRGSRPADRARAHGECCHHHGRDHRALQPSATGVNPHAARPSIGRLPPPSADGCPVPARSAC